MLELFRKSWWTISLRGALIAIFGVLAVMDMGKQTSSADQVYNGFTIFVKLGFIFALSGAIVIATGFFFRNRLKNWFVLILSGIPDIILSVVIFVNGQATTAYFGKIMGIWILIVGLVLIFAATRVNKVLRIILGILGLVCLIFGAFVELNEMTSLFIVYGAISYFTILLGLVIFALGFAARKLGGNKDESNKKMSSSKEIEENNG